MEFSRSVFFSGDKKLDADMYIMCKRPVACII